ncbi:acidic repeat-containing protein [Phyllostomus hastatus]|uniref:acidic repeat-containing protein n=1 Tax=Phyllostomus hastatus TaxID=9423 RepID=UPI001E685560|nr:acidic repeat-containing protein [Phyllostomus hastatus]
MNENPFQENFSLQPTWKLSGNWRLQKRQKQRSPTSGPRTSTGRSLLGTGCTEAGCGRTSRPVYRLSSAFSASSRPMTMTPPPAVVGKIGFHKVGPCRCQKDHEERECEVIDLDTDDDDAPPPEKQQNTSKVTNQAAPEQDGAPGAEYEGSPQEDEMLESSSDSLTKFVEQEMPIVITSDDDSDVDVPVIIEDSASDDDQMRFQVKRCQLMERLYLRWTNQRKGSVKPNIYVCHLCFVPDLFVPRISHFPEDPALLFPVRSAVVKGQKRTRSLEEVPQPQPKRKRTKPAKSTSKRKGTESADPSSKRKRAELPSKRKRAGLPKRKPRAEKSPQPSHEHEHEHKHENLNCNIPGCFLRDIEKLKEYTGRNFKRNKDELVRRLYVLFNETVFDKKLPEKLEICWNKKMLRTAGLCSSTHSSKTAKRQTKIDISLKVCDSADRIRDTLAHELCHAACWLLNGIRTSHGYTWKYYARKCNLAHPELPLVTRFHNYKINYKIYYECTRCKARIGRYSRSLDTERSVCTSCKGRLVLLPLFRKDGTPIKPHVRPFAKYVKQHYRIQSVFIDNLCQQQNKLSGLPSRTPDS